MGNYMLVVAATFISESFRCEVIKYWVKVDGMTVGCVKLDSTGYSEMWRGWKESKGSEDANWQGQVSVGAYEYLKDAAEAVVSTVD